MLVCCHALKWKRNDSNEPAALCSFFLRHGEKYVRSEIVTIRAIFSFFSAEMWTFPGEKSTFGEFFMPTGIFFSSPPDSYFSHFHLHHRRRHSTRTTTVLAKVGVKRTKLKRSQWELSTLSLSQTMAGLSGRSEWGKSEIAKYFIHTHNTPCEWVRERDKLRRKKSSEWKMSVWEICWNDKFAGDDYVGNVGNGDE